MVLFDLVRISFVMIKFVCWICSDECDRKSECNCSRKFRNDDHHQYILSNSHRLTPKQRLDLIALMQNDVTDTRQSFLRSPILHETIRTSSSSSSIVGEESSRKISNSEEVDCTTKLTCSTDGFRRKKSASLNSPANSGKAQFDIFFFGIDFFLLLFRTPSNG